MRMLTDEDIARIAGGGLWDEAKGWISFATWARLCSDSYAPTEYKACMNRNGWNTDGTRYYG